MALLYGLSMLAIVTVVYHVEGRYLLVLHPLLAIALAAALIRIFDAVASRLHESRRRVAAFVAMAAAGATFSLGFVRVLQMQRAFGQAANPNGACEDTMAFIRANVGADEPILTSNPWLVAWATNRPAIIAPTNGAAAFATVAEHYGAR